MSCGRPAKDILDYDCTYRGWLNRQPGTCSVIVLEPDCHHFMVYLFKKHLHVISFRNQLLFVLGFFFYTLML